MRIEVKFPLERVYNRNLSRRKTYVAASGGNNAEFGVRNS